MSRIVGLPPVANKYSKVLILGSMPGAESLRRQQYYAHPRNQFWAIMGKLLNVDLLDKDYEAKRTTLLDHRIALWDVLASCERTGSLDASIRGSKVNAMEPFLKEHPSIKAIFINGGKALQLFQENFGNIDIPVISLPSSSPAHAVSLEVKMRQWKGILNFLGRK